MRDFDAAEARADAIMENLALMDPADPEMPAALRSADAELAELATRFAGVPWLDVGLAVYRGRVRQELWERLGDRADLDAACDLLRGSVEHMPEPDVDAVFSLLLAVGDRLQEAPSPGDRNTFVTWGSWLLDWRSAQGEELGSFPLDEKLMPLRAQAACLLHDRAQSGEGDPVADLDAAIAHFELLVVASPEGPERTENLVLLVSALWDRLTCPNRADSDTHRQQQVDRLVRYASEVWADPGLSDDDVRTPIGAYLGIAIFEQITQPSWAVDIALLDRGVDVLSKVQPHLSEEPDIALTAESVLGLLLVSRGQVSGVVGDMVAAEPYLTHAASLLATDDPQWSDVTYNLAIAQTVLATAGLGAIHSDLAARLLRAAAEHAPADPEKSAMIDLGLSSVLLGRAVGQRGPDADEGIEHLTAAFRKLPVESPTRLLISWNLCSALTARFFAVGDRQDLQAAQFYLESVEEARTTGWSGALAGLVPDMEFALALVHAQVAAAHASDGDLALLDSSIEGLRAAVRLAGPEHPLAPRLLMSLGQALMVRYTHGGENLADLQDAANQLEAATRLVPDGHLLASVARSQAVWPLTVLGLRSQDERVLREVAARMRQVRVDWGEGPGYPARLAAGLALIHAELYKVTRDAADLANARDWSAEAVAEFERQPGDPQHGTLLIVLARLERRVGARQAAVRSGLAALRVRARDVLLQTGPAHGLMSARIAAAEAAEIAGWCLQDGETALAVEALELGRGLVLHAATSAADMPELLISAGRPDLAGEWHRLAARQAADEPWDDVIDVAGLLQSESITIPSDLRRRALDALGTDALIAPPGHRAIAAALTRTGVDALVYLLPPAHGAPGRALVIPANGTEPRDVPLPLLHPKISGALDEYAAVQASLLAVPSQGDEAERRGQDTLAQWRRALGTLCEWAWTAVMKPLLAAVPSGTPGAPARLVLVPTGRLGIVPWHAARRPAAVDSVAAVDNPGSAWRYAIADAVLSYAASGRQLVEVSRRPVLPLADDPVIVVPPDDLPDGCWEAMALRERYPNARYLGFAFDGRADGPAVPKAVLGVLPAVNRSGASLLHLVCHGLATSAGADASYLLLENGQTLTVKAIIRQAQGRPPGAPGGLVDLMACRTDLTATDHDEALTLSTAFLTAGAVTVVGSRWEIPDLQSAVLMFVFHHFLAGGCSARDALRAAQLWMLDPGRVAPAEMPRALRKWLDHADAPAKFAQVEAWAGLTHQGW